MKTIIGTLILASLILTGCKKPQEPLVQPPEIKTDSTLYYKMLKRNLKNSDFYKEHKDASIMIMVDPKLEEAFYQKDSTGVSDYDREVIYLKEAL